MYTISTNVLHALCIICKLQNCSFKLAFKSNLRGMATTFYSVFVAVGSKPNVTSFSCIVPLFKVFNVVVFYSFFLILCGSIISVELTVGPYLNGHNKFLEAVSNRVELHGTYRVSVLVIVSAPALCSQLYDAGLTATVWLGASAAFSYCSCSCCCHSLLRVVSHGL